ncbi:hypothetical protein D3C85_1257360 [compost metagenome]
MVLLERGKLAGLFSRLLACGDLLLQCYVTLELRAQQLLTGEQGLLVGCLNVLILDIGYLLLESSKRFGLRAKLLGRIGLDLQRGGLLTQTV